MCVRSFLAVGSALLVSALLAAAASAGPYKVKNLQAISGPSPFAAGCPGALFDDTNITGHELETMITVNPANPRNIIATWKQDVGPDSTRSDLVASSQNGGKTWTRTTIPDLTVCTGGTADTGSDPWLSAGGDGTVYFSGLAADISTDPPTTAVVASHSGDGGRTWPSVATVAPPLQGNETDAITGSPTLDGHAYTVWANFTFDFPRTNTLEFSRTTDSGATWSPAVLIDQPGPFAWDQAPRLLVLPDGTLLTLFARTDLEAGFGAHYAARSLDEGQTWLPPVELGPRLPLTEFLHPEFGHLPQPHFPSAAVAPDGTAYVAFENNSSATSGGIGVAKSRDGGLTWSSSTLRPQRLRVRAGNRRRQEGHGRRHVVRPPQRPARRCRPYGRCLVRPLPQPRQLMAADARRRPHRPPNRTASRPQLRGRVPGARRAPPRVRRRLHTGIPASQNGPTDIFFARIRPGDGDDQDDRR